MTGSQLVNADAVFLPAEFEERRIPVGVRDAHEVEGFSEGRSNARLVKLRGGSYALMLVSPVLGENLWVIHPLTHRGLLLCFPRGAAKFSFEAGDDAQDWLNALASDRKHEKMPMHGWAGLFEPVGWAAMLEAWQGDLSLLLSLW